MKLTFAKVFVRVVGTIAGLQGLGMLCITLFLLYRAIMERHSWMILFSALILALGVYLIYIAYLAWFRLSPFAVRHTCGALGFFVLTMLTTTRDLPVSWALFVFLGGIVTVYVGYVIASDRLSRILFPDNLSVSK